MTPEALIAHVDKSIAKALLGESHVAPSILQIKGFSTATQRHLVNNLASKMGFYLEVGLFRGATLCAAVSGNPNLHALGIEDLSQPFGEEGVEQDLRRNIMPFLSDKVDVILKDYAKVHACQMPVDLYFYDGAHGREDQARALPHFFECMADTFLYMVDDASWSEVAIGTVEGFERLHGRVSVDKTWKLDEGKPDSPLWHNGILIYCCHKL